MSKRSFPRSITIFGLANTVLGFCGLVSGLSALIQPHMTVAQNVYQQVNLPTQSMQWLHVAMVLSPISFALMLACGIGLLRKKLWGRTLAIYYGYGSITFSLIASSINVWRIADRADNPLILNIIFSIVLSVLLGLAYKATMVYCLTRPKVKESLVNQQVGAEILEFTPRRRQWPRR
jgi:hypothetical protein